MMILVFYVVRAIMMKIIFFLCKFDQIACVNVIRFNNDENEHENEDENAKTISAEPKGVEVAETKKAETESEESEAGTETEEGKIWMPKGTNFYFKS
jgi:hypothetical protein